MAANPLTIQSLGTLLNGQSSSATPVPMTQASASTGLNQFFNTPGAQLMYGQNPAQQTANGGSFNPATAFQNDPGVQMAVQQGQIPINNSFAARGLGQSGALSQALTQNLYNNYSNYTAGLGSAFNNYQGQLAQLSNAGMGANSQNATNQYNAGTTLSQLLSNANLSTGQNLASVYGNTGSNISSLVANQGVLGASGYLNTGAAQSNNYMQAMNLAAQVAANQNASMASGQGGAGAMQGSQSYGLF